MRKTLLATTAFALVAAIMAALPVQAQVATISRTDLDPSASTVISAGLANATSPTYFDNDGRTVFLIKNGNGSPITATFTSNFTSYFVERLGFVALSNQVNTIASGTTVLYGPFGTERWNTANNTIQVNFSTLTNVSITALRLPK